MSLEDCWPQLQMEMAVAVVGDQIKQTGWFMDGKTRESRRHNASSSAASWRSCRGSQVAAEKASK